VPHVLLVVGVRVILNPIDFDGTLVGTERQRESPPTQITLTKNGKAIIVPEVAGDAEVLSPSPPKLAAPFPAGRKSAAGRLFFFLPVGNCSKISLTVILAYVLA
jgi:hypothetical protein